MQSNREYIKELPQVSFPTEEETLRQLIVQENDKLQAIREKKRVEKLRKQLARMQKLVSIAEINS